MFSVSASNGRTSTAGSTVETCGDRGRRPPPASTPASPPGPTRRATAATIAVASAVGRVQRGQHVAGRPRVAAEALDRRPATWPTTSRASRQRLGGRAGGVDDRRRGRRRRRRRDSAAACSVSAARRLVDRRQRRLGAAGDDAEHRRVHLLHGEAGGDVDRRLLERVELLVEHRDRGALAGEDLVEGIGREHDDGVELAVLQPPRRRRLVAREALRVDVLARARRRSR